VIDGRPAATSAMGDTSSRSAGNSIADASKHAGAGASDQLRGAVALPPKQARAYGASRLSLLVPIERLGAARSDARNKAKKEQLVGGRLCVGEQVPEAVLEPGRAIRSPESLGGRLDCVGDHPLGHSQVNAVDRRNRKQGTLDGRPVGKLVRHLDFAGAFGSEPRLPGEAFKHPGLADRGRVMWAR
jgi:hypothetical protein